MSKLSKQKLEAFDKMLVDKFNKQEKELNTLKENYEILKEKYIKALKEIEIFTEQINLLKGNIKKTDPYKHLKEQNKTLTLKIRDLHRLRDRLIAKIAKYENSTKTDKALANDN